MYRADQVDTAGKKKTMFLYGKLLVNTVGLPRLRKAALESGFSKVIVHVKTNKMLGKFETFGNDSHCLHFTDPIIVQSVREGPKA